MCRPLQKVYDLSDGTIFNILLDNQGLEKKRARQVPKLLTQDQVDKGVESSAVFVKLIQMKGRGILSKSLLWT